MKKTITIVAAIAALVSCQKSTVASPDQSYSDELLPVNISMGVETKVSDTEFDEGDKVGVYMVNYVNGIAGTLKTTGNHYDNVQFTFGNAWTGSQTMYWLDKTTKADFYCYHPYAAPSDVNNHVFQTNADQSTLASYKASDFVWGKTAGVAPSKDNVDITTSHIFSNVKIYVTPGDGFTAETLAAAKIGARINDVYTGASINLTDGSVTPAGSVTDVTPYYYTDGKYYRAVVVPQTVADGSELIILTVNGVDYALKKGFTFRSGVRHKFTVKVNKTSGGINVGVGDWEDEDIDNGGDAE